MDSSSEKTFHDIHLHAFNLSHPYFRAFISRFNIRFLLVLTPTVTPIVSALVTLATNTPFLRRILFKKGIDVINRMKNLLPVMENDAGSYLLLENCLRENKMLDNEGLNLGGETYSRIVLTPLMMDFGYKGSGDKEIRYVHYKEHSRKPIKKQVINVYNGIRDYAVFDYKELISKALFNKTFRSLSQDERKSIWDKCDYRISDHMPIWIRLPLPGSVLSHD